MIDLRTDLQNLKLSISQTEKEYTEANSNLRELEDAKQLLKEEMNKVSNLERNTKKNKSSRE